jgi:anti-sigma regulatory factor (Ser/Thr protein kinase)
VRAAVNSNSLVIRNQLSELLRLSSWVEAWAHENGVSAILAQCIDLCATELVTNVMSYAYDDAAVHPIKLHLHTDEDRISLEIEDDGKPFDPLETPARPRSTDLDKGRVGGWGIVIVRHFADDVQYCRADERNRLTAVFRHAHPAPQ